MKLLNVAIDGPIDQLYHPTGKLGQDKYEKVYAKGYLGTTKFDPILIKEWFYLVKKGGVLVVDYQLSHVNLPRDIEKLFWWLWKQKYKILYHAPSPAQTDLKYFIKKVNLSPELVNLTSEHIGKWVRLVVRKEVDSIINGDDINKWTFGIITNGKRVENVNKILTSIRQQKIPNFEIIICGTWFERLDADSRYLPFSLRDSMGWITKKKNMIVSAARFENVCIVHDRMVLDENWYKGMKKWGNCFEVLGCIQMHNQTRLIDWVVPNLIITKANDDDFYVTSYLDYKDWYSSAWLLGQLNIFKKSIILNHDLWYDENRYWMEKEDYYFSKALNQAGYIHRFNPEATVYSLSFNYLKPSYVEFAPKSQQPKLKMTDIGSWSKIGIWLLAKVLLSPPANLNTAKLEEFRANLYKLVFR